MRISRLVTRIGRQHSLRSVNRAIAGLFELGGRAWARNRYFAIQLRHILIVFAEIVFEDGWWGLAVLFARDEAGAIVDSTIIDVLEGSTRDRRVAGSVWISLLLLLLKLALALICVLGP